MGYGISFLLKPLKADFGTTIGTTIFIAWAYYRQ